MNLRTLIEKSLTILRSKVIGCEFYVGEEKVLLLGLQTLVDNSIDYDNDDEEIINEAKTCIYLLYKSEPDETEYDEDDDFNVATNRQDMLMDLKLQAERTSGVSDIESFNISGKTFTSRGMSNGPLYDTSYITGNMIKLAAEIGAISDEWLDVDTEELWLAEYEVDNSIYELDWEKSSNKLSVEFEGKDIRNHVGHVFSCKCNEKEINRTISIDDDIVGHFDIKIMGLHTMEMFDEKAIVLEYEATDKITPHFYSKRFLDDDFGEGSVGICVFGRSDENPSSRFEFIEYVEDEDGKESIQIELFSYTVNQDEN